MRFNWLYSVHACNQNGEKRLKRKTEHQAEGHEHCSLNNPQKDTVLLRLFSLSLSLSFSVSSFGILWTKSIATVIVILIPYVVCHCHHHQVCSMLMHPFKDHWILGLLKENAFLYNFLINDAVKTASNSYLSGIVNMVNGEWRSLLSFRFSTSLHRINSKGNSPKQWAHESLFNIYCIWNMID